MILVVGGSGLLGRHVVGDLMSRGESVRVLVRDARRARSLLGTEVELVAGDVRHAETVSEAVTGASVVVSAMHGFLGGRGAGPTEVDQQGNANLLGAATTAGSDVILLSVLGAAPQSTVELFRAKHEAEQQLRAGTAPWTIVRSAAFLETWLTILIKTAGSSGRPVVFGRGEQPIDFVSARDVAEVVSRACTDVTLRGQVVQIAGPSLTMNELARAVQDARGWRGAPRHLPRSLMGSLAIITRPVNAAFARQNRTARAMDTVPIPFDPAAGSLIRAQESPAQVLARLPASS